MGNYYGCGAIRSDAKYTVKELPKKVRQPNTADARGVKRVLKYLAGTRRLVSVIKPTSWNFDAQIEVWTDADLGGCPITRSSTSGGAMFLNNTLVHEWSKQQSTVALSSAEAEYVALCRAASECLYIIEFLSEMNVDCNTPVIYTDSKAALDMVSKRTSGRVKHLDRKLYAIKDWVRKKLVELQWIPGADNLADLYTKYVNRDTLERHRGKLVQDVAEKGLPPPQNLPHK